MNEEIKDSNVSELEETSKDIWITTVDNPYDPFRQWDHWYRYDMAMGYDTCGNVAKLAGSNENLSPFEDKERTLLAIIELCKIGFVTGVGDCLSQYHLAIEGECSVW